MTFLSTASWPLRVAPALKAIPLVNHIGNKNLSLGISWFHGSFHHLNFLSLCTIGKREAEDKVSSQHGLGMMGREVPLCPNNTPGEPTIMGSSISGVWLELSIPLSVFVSLSDFNFLSILKKRKAEEIKQIIGTHSISHKSTHLILTIILEESCYDPYFKITKWWLREGKSFPQGLLPSKSVYIQILFSFFLHIMLFSSYYVPFISQSLFNSDLSLVP